MTFDSDKFCKNAYKIYDYISNKMMQSSLVIFFPEMHQNSHTAIKDFSYFLRKETTGTPLLERGKRRGRREVNDS